MGTWVASTPSDLAGLIVVVERHTKERRFSLNSEDQERREEERREDHSSKEELKRWIDDR